MSSYNEWSSSTIGSDDNKQQEANLSYTDQIMLIYVNYKDWRWICHIVVASLTMLHHEENFGI